MAKEKIRNLIRTSSNKESQCRRITKLKLIVNTSTTRRVIQRDNIEMETHTVAHYIIRFEFKIVWGNLESRNGVFANRNFGIFDVDELVNEIDVNASP